MEHDRTELPDHEEEQPQQDELPVVDTSRPTPRGPFTLASLLDLDENELAEPLPRIAPTEHRWEQLTLGVAPETGEAVPSALRSAAPTEMPDGDRELIPGLDVPGAVEVPVYLAGRALQDLLAGAPPANTDASEPPAVLDDAAWSVVDGDGTTTPTPVRVETRKPTPKKPPALVTPVRGTPRRSMDPPAANFAKAESAPVLWPKKKTPAGVLVAKYECAACHAPMPSDTCKACGGTERVRAKRRVARDLISAGLESENRGVRTITALLLSPGELTVTHLAGQTRRYLGPAVVTVIALVLFSAISMIGSLRPRPDRSLGIGAERTTEVAAGLSDRSPVELARQDAPGFVRDIAAAVDFVPVIWFPIAALLMLGVVAALRAPERRDGEASTVFTAHTMTWFVAWWGAGVPLLLLLLRFGFESSAALQGVQQVRYLANGGLAGVSPGWNAARDIVASGTFHSLLLACGLVPWVTLAWDRTFRSGRPKAVMAALIVTAVPILLLVPFA